MLDAIQSTGVRPHVRLAGNVEIAAVATAVPDNVVGQEETRRRAQHFYPQYAHMLSLYDNTGVETRHCCEPTEWYLVPHTWEERTAAFRRHAIDLLERAAVEAVAKAGLQIGEIDALVVNTITGLAVPSLDAMLMNRLPFRPDIERLPIFGIGCGGGAAGLARSARLAESLGEGNVLFLAVDLCSLCLRINDPQLAMFVSAALFGDGAAGVVIRSRAGDRAGGGRRVVSVGEHFWRDTEQVMGWDVRNDGFGIVLSPELPSLMRARFGDALAGYLARAGIRRDELDGVILHPGSSRVLDVAERLLGLSPDALLPSRETLRRFGNMSSATILFVLQNALQAGRTGRHLVAAFGPGFSAYFVVVDL
jgi:alkylresorcinol/alkylpyrone synthase